MAVAVQAIWQASCTVRETLDSTSVPGASTADRVVTHGQFNGYGAIDANSTVPATKCAVFNKAMTAGAATIDLTALTHNGQAVDFTGLRVQLIQIENPSTNAAIRIKTGASTGYLPAGTGTTFDFTAPPGFFGTLYFADQGQDVSSSLKHLDISGTGTQSLSICLVAG